LAEIPVWFTGLCVYPFVVFGPVWTGCFDKFEIGMWVTLDLFFGVSHSLVMGTDFLYGHFGLLTVTGCVEVKEKSRRYVRDRC
jgi:hypothetical protein